MPCELVWLLRARAQGRLSGESCCWPQLSATAASERGRLAAATAVRGGDAHAHTHVDGRRRGGVRLVRRLAGGRSYIGAGVAPGEGFCLEPLGMRGAR